MHRQTVCPNSFWYRWQYIHRPTFGAVTYIPLYTRNLSYGSRAGLLAFKAGRNCKSGDVSVSSLETVKEQEKSDSHMSAIVTVSKRALTTPLTQRAIQNRTSLHELLNITTSQSEEVDSKTGIVVVYGITDFVPQRPFHILVTNLNNLSTRLHKRERSQGYRGRPCA